MKSRFRGFTLIEMILVMAVITTLAAVFLNTYPAAQSRARDSRRKSDINQYASVLEVYANSHNSLFPGSITGQSFSTAPCTTLGVTSCVVDPRDGENVCHGNNLCRYYYHANNCDNLTACATQYFIRARMESEADWWVICSDGRRGTVPGTWTDANFNSQLGNCPTGIVVD